MAHLGGKRGAYQVWWGDLGERTLGRPTRRWKDIVNIAINFVASRNLSVSAYRFIFME
jgi:hypothetical protein